MSSSSLRLIASRFRRTKTLISLENPPRVSSFLLRPFTSQTNQTATLSSQGSSSNLSHTTSASSISRSDSRIDDPRLEMSSDEQIGSDTAVFEPRATRIREKLQKELDPVELMIEDVSYQHAGHAAMRGKTDGETHFNVKIVSKGFEGMNLVKRHRLVYDLLRDELESGLHALSIVAKTPPESDR